MNQTASAKASAFLSTAPARGSRFSRQATSLSSLAPPAAVLNNHCQTQAAADEKRIEEHYPRRLAHEHYTKLCGLWRTQLGTKGQAEERGLRVEKHPNIHR